MRIGFAQRIETNTTSGRTRRITEAYRFGATKGAYKRFSLSVPLSDALRVAYRVPKNDKLRSIDSFKSDGGILSLFQMKCG